jgi:hypothetical protein
MLYSADSYRDELRAFPVWGGKNKAKTVAGKINIGFIKPGFIINSAFLLLLALPYETSFLGNWKKS